MHGYSLDRLFIVQVSKNYGIDFEAAVSLAEFRKKKA